MTPEREVRVIGPDRGYIFATTGADYTALAVRSARLLRGVAPGEAIDLFTDQTGIDGPFDAVHPLGDDWFRPKFEALTRSRFDRTIYLDADIWAVADPSDVFDLLDRFDLAMAHDPYRATEHATAIWRVSIPAAFPQYNSGVIGCRAGAATHALLRAVIDGVRGDGLSRDQGALRELLWQSDLRIATLPEEYNFMGLRGLNVMSSDTAAPRLVHSPRLHAAFRKGKGDVGSLDGLLGRVGAAQLARLVAADPTLGGNGARVRPMIRRGAMNLLSYPLGLIRGRFER